MTTVTSLVNEIKEELDNITLDAAKCDKGNNQAGIRVRKSMLAIIYLAKSVRKKYSILAHRFHYDRSLSSFSFDHSLGGRRVWVAQGNWWLPAISGAAVVTVWFKCLSPPGI